MTKQTDAELLQQFSRTGSEAAFEALVRRHINLVYSAAVRQLGSLDLAKDVTQSVFIDLSRHARSVDPDKLLSAWLYQVTHRTAIDLIRRETRRQQREQIAVELADMQSADTHWKDVQPLLDDAMAELSEADRNSLLLRFFENKSLREVGQALQTSEDAAQKRVSRAVEQLRELLTRRGVAVGGAALVATLSANAVQAAPVSLISSIAVAAKAAGTVTTATVVAQAATHWLTAKTVLAVAASAVLAGSSMYYMQQPEITDLRGQNQNLLAQQNALTKQSHEVLATTTNTTRELERLRQNESELLRLRGEVAVLRRQAFEAQKLQTEKITRRNVEQAAPVDSSSGAPAWNVEAVFQKNRCINNLRQIMGAMEQCALEHRLGRTDSVTEKDIAPYISGLKLPQCPAGGTYTFGVLSESPTCSIPGHELPH